MTAKEYLSQIRSLDHSINNSIAEIYRLKSMAVSITIEPKGDSICVSGEKDRMGNIIAKIVDLQKELESDVESYTKKRNELIEKINTLENKEYRDVLTQRFVLCKPFDSIYESIHMSRSKMFYVYDNALEFFGNKYKKELEKI